MQSIQDKILSALQSPPKAKAAKAQTATAMASEAIAKQALENLKRKRTLEKWKFCVRDVMQRSKLNHSQCSAIVSKFETLANRVGMERAFLDIVEMYSAWEDPAPELARAKASFLQN